MGVELKSLSEKFESILGLDSPPIAVASADCGRETCTKIFAKIAKRAGFSEREIAETPLIARFPAPEFLMDEKGER
jgi:hypothetical protein